MPAELGYYRAGELPESHLLRATRPRRQRTNWQGTAGHGPRILTQCVLHRVECLACLSANSLTMQPKAPQKWCFCGGPVHSLCMKAGSDRKHSSSAQASLSCSCWGYLTG